ncbi:MAG TPA: tetratricopeptide repeat protein [Terracidiphilus sp.]|nr:tetratricopeptide repeat protein [Terracidiphilus sp.]
MPNSKMRPIFTSILFLLGVALLVAGAVLFFLSGGTGPTPDERVPGGLSAAGAEAINKYCQENRDVIEQMPQHPRTREVLDHVVAVWRQDARIEKQAALEEVTKAFRNSALGLAALNECLAGGTSSADTFCRELVEQEPDSRVACMALDRLLETAPDSAGALLDGVIAANPGTRVSVFGLTIKGDRARDRGEMTVAAQCWLDAWIADPKRVKPLYDNLCLYWLQNGDWYYPLLMPAEFREDAVLTPVKQHGLAAIGHEGASDGSSRTSVCQAGKALQVGDTDSAVTAVEQAMAQGAAVAPEDKAFFGTAVFLVGAEKDYTITLDLKTSLKAKRALTQCRERCLEWAQEGSAALPRELRACYALQIARRRLQDGQVRPAVDALEAAWREKSLEPWWRERVLEELSKTLVEENAAYAEAASAYAAYCEESPANEARLRLISADLFYRARESKQSLEQIDKLVAIAEGEALLPAALLLRGINYLDQGNTDEAKAALEQLALNHPQNELAAQALFLLGKTALASGDSKTAQAYYQDLVDRYPESPRAEEARIVVTRLKEQQ